MKNSEDLKRISLLFVEDEKLARTHISKVLKKRVGELFIAKDGVEGLELYKKHKPDIILTDITMPRMNGLEMAKAIYEIDEEATVIIETAHNETDFLIKAIEIGVKSYVIKPIDPILLINAISKSTENVLIKKELKERDEILLQQSLLNAKADLLHDIAHHWRQPLSQIALLAETLYMDYEDGELTQEKFKSSVDIISKTTADLSKIINIFTSSYSSKSKRFKLSEAVDTLLFVTKSLYEESDIKIIKENFEERIIYGSGDIFLQIVSYIFTNSIEAHSENSTKEPSISIKFNADENSLTIEDNAGGVNPDILNNLTEPYFSTKRNLNGKGLGLFVANFLIQKEFNGELNLENIESGLKVSLKFSKDRE